MTGCATTGRRLIRCPALVRVDGGGRVPWIAGSAEVHADSGGLVCELVAGHGGSHVALFATTDGGDRWWWLRWAGPLGDSTEVLQINPCDAELPQGRYADDCFLPDRHAGPHSFHLAPLTSPAENAMPSALTVT
jgi:hypothetical protein